MKNTVYLGTPYKILQEERSIAENLAVLMENDARRGSVLVKQSSSQFDKYFDQSNIVRNTSFVLIKPKNYILQNKNATAIIKRKNLSMDLRMPSPAATRKPSEAQDSTTDLDCKDRQVNQRVRLLIRKSAANLHRRTISTGSDSLAAMAPVKDNRLTADTHQYIDKSHMQYIADISHPVNKFMHAAKSVYRSKRLKSKTAFYGKHTLQAIQEVSNKMEDILRSDLKVIREHMGSLALTSPEISNRHQNVLDNIRQKNMAGNMMFVDTMYQLRRKNSTLMTELIDNLKEASTN